MIYNEFLSLQTVYRLRRYVRRHQTQINCLNLLHSRSVSKQAKQSYLTQIAYHTKQIESTYNQYPEYFL